jgi:hypothetical protein
MKKILLWSAAALILVGYSGCKKDDPEEPEVANTEVQVNFHHFVDGSVVEMDTLKYLSALGDTYSVRTIKYFITRLTFHRSGKSDVMLKDMHYVEEGLDDTKTHVYSAKIPSGTYTGVSFTYGFVNADNISYMFANPPEYQMFWPENMGGGYHYQKIEGQYLVDGIRKFYNFHSGGLDDVDYSIHIDLPNSGFTVVNNQVTIDLTMEIANWFSNPTDWDFDYFGAAIMGNHEAQETIQKNGVDVFTATIN